MRANDCREIVAQRCVKAAEQVGAMFDPPRSDEDFSRFLKPDNWRCSFKRRTEVHPKVVVWHFVCGPLRAVVETQLHTVLSVQFERRE